MTRTVILALLVAAVFASDRTYQAGDLSPANMPPIFDNGHLIVRGLNGIEVYGPDGALAYRIPRGTDRSPVNVAVDLDGTAAIAVELKEDAGAIDILAPGAAARLRGIDTGDFLPSYVAFGPDHSIWAAGVVLGAANHAMLRHFSSEGMPLGSYLPRSDFPQYQLLTHVSQMPALRVSSGRIGLEVIAARTNYRVWVETDFGGKELGRWPIPADARPSPVLAGDNAYVSTPAGILMLERNTGAWKPTPVVAQGWLIGSDRTGLVVADRGSPTVRWIETASR